MTLDDHIEALDNLACVTPVFPCHEGRRYMALVARGYRG